MLTFKFQAHTKPSLHSKFRSFPSEIGTWSLNKAAFQPSKNRQHSYNLSSLRRALQFHEDTQWDVHYPSSEHPLRWMECLSNVPAVQLQWRSVCPVLTASFSTEITFYSFFIIFFLWKCKFLWIYIILSLYSTFIFLLFFLWNCLTYLFFLHPLS